MKRYIYIILAISALHAVSCKVDDIDTYSMENSAVVFQTEAVQFSMKGVTEEYTEKTLTLDLVGRIADYDRKIDLRVIADAANTAIQDVDFKIGEAVMKAGEYVAEVDFLIHKMPEGVDNQNVTIEIVPNEHFRKGYPKTSKVYISWSEEYVRPSKSVVWKDWFDFFCRGYSRNYHKVLVEVFGEEIETYTRSVASAREDETLTLKLNDWWYGAQSKLVDYVRKYDAAHPDAPLMHSDDYETYTTYKDPVGTGKRPERIPTIYETLLQY
ncbi:MAG: DUF4843 domain-containing protein [Bacteroidales bacterium]|nr:DUF4843 domain-containing protein [Bacteroidales bacterium]